MTDRILSFRQSINALATGAAALLGVAALLAGCAGPGVREAGSATRPRSNHDAAYWQATARTDLLAVRQQIESTHPGMIDELNPGFARWVEQGYNEALGLLPRVDSYDGVLAAVRHYVTGFRDGHLFYSDNVRQNEPLSISGWAVASQNGQPRVTGVVPNWPTPLPPIGARLVECDGKGLPELAAQLAPYVSRRDSAATKQLLLTTLGTRTLAGSELKRCRFETAIGQALDLPLTYQQVDFETFFNLGRTQPQTARRENGMTVADGTLWVHAANFMPSADSMKQLEATLDKLRTLDLGPKGGIKRIVFDTRGNGGGDSGIGDRLFEAATGGLAYDETGLDRHSTTYAQWRVSPQLVKALSDRVAMARERFGESSADVNEAEARLTEAKVALALGKPWVDQSAGPLLRRADVALRKGRLKRFKGPVVLVTDARCVSACLDFADLVRRVPGSIHLGQTTDSDTLYIDVGYFPMPSGNLLVVPLKVWRNRERGADEALVPDRQFSGDMNDDAAVRQAVMAALAPAVPEQRPPQTKSRTR